MKLTEGVLDLGKWHAEESSRWAITYWYFIDVQDSVETMGVYTHDGWLYVGLLGNRHMKIIAGRSRPLDKPPLLELKHPAEKQEAIDKIFSRQNIRHS